MIDMKSLFIGSIVAAISCVIGIVAGNCCCESTCSPAACPAPTGCCTPAAEEVQNRRLEKLERAVFKTGSSEASSAEGLVQ